MKPINVSVQLVDATISSLRQSGQHGQEGVVFWLAPLNAPNCISEIYRPEVIAERDFFVIRPAVMEKLLAHLSFAGVKIAAQVHSHPKDAFHSRADDRWAIVRHEGALSLVVPRFASDTTVANFADRIAAYRLSQENRWIEVPRDDLDSQLIVV